MRTSRIWNVVFVLILVLIALPPAAIWQNGFWQEWFQTAHSGTGWQLPGAWGFHAYDVLNSILLFATLVYIVRSVTVAESALNKSHHAYVQSLVDNRYDAMDKLYFDLLKERRQRPYPHAGAGGEGRDPYPLMVWNFIETIIDKCEKDPAGELMQTWAPLVSAEARNFGTWMLQKDASGNLLQSPYFKNEFMLLAKALIPVSTETLDKGEDLEGSVFLRLFRALERIKDVSDLDGRMKPEQEYVWLKDRLKREKFSKFNGEEEFLAVFRKIHDTDDLRKAAKEGWELPEDIRHDDLKNNEKEREDYIRARHCALINKILPQVMALTSAGGKAAT